MSARIVHLERTTSTQDDAKRAANEGAEAMTTFVAEEQERGRGRQGRAWIAPRGSALLASVVLWPSIDPRALPPLSLVVGLSICAAVTARVARARVGIKWPNDVLVDGRKVAGVLIDASLRGSRVEHVIAGFGVNLTRAALPEELSKTAVSLEEAGARDSALDRDALLADILEDLEARVRAYERDGLAGQLAELRERDVARGREVSGESASGVADGIDDAGRLLVRTERGVVAVSAGEVVFRPG